MTRARDEWWRDNDQDLPSSPPRNNARRSHIDGFEKWFDEKDQSPRNRSLTDKRNSIMAKEQWWRESRTYESAKNMNAMLAEIDTEEGHTVDTETNNQNQNLCRVDCDAATNWWLESLQFDKLSQDISSFFSVNFNFQAEQKDNNVETQPPKQVSLDDVPIPLSSDDMFGDEHDDDASTYVTSQTVVRQYQDPTMKCCGVCCCCPRVTANDVCVALLHLMVVGMGATIVAFTSSDIKLLWQCYTGDDTKNDDYYSYSSSSMCHEDQLSLTTILIPILMFLAGASMVLCSSGYIILGQCCGVSIDCGSSQSQNKQRNNNNNNNNNNNKHNKHNNNNSHQRGEC